MQPKRILKSTAAAAALMTAGPVVSAVPAEAGNWAGGNQNGVVMSGRIVRSLLYQHDGENSELFHVDGATDSSRLRWVITGQMTENVQVGGLIEMNIPLSNPAGAASFDASGNGTYVNGDTKEWGIRHTKVDFKHRSMGAFSIGQSSVASDGAYEQHLGGLAHIGVGACDYGCKTVFTHSSNGAASTVQVGKVASSYDGGRDDRIRYDSSSMGGFKGAFSVQDGNSWDLALTHGGKFGSVQLASAFAYRHLAEDDKAVKAIYGGSVAAKHDSGLNGSFGLSKKQAKDHSTSVDGYHWHLAVGYDANLTDLGQTALTFVYGRNEDSINDGDKSNYMKFVVNQDLPAGIDVFAAYSQFNYDPVGPDYNDISQFLVGTRLRF